MCFSATASFGAGAVLLALGALSSHAVRQRPPREWAFAALPLLFGLQQLIEGGVWLTLADPALNAVLTQAFAAFALLLWPVYLPLAVLGLEPPGPRRQALGGLVLVGLGVSGWLLMALWDTPVQVLPVGGHLRYVSPHTGLAPTMALYTLATAFSLLVSGHAEVRTFGMLVLTALVISLGAYGLWLISVWCFFAAALSAQVLRQVRAGRARAAWTAG